MTSSPTDPGWWRSAVVYQVYPRSFADTNGDGIGDLPGIIDHLDHLAGASDSLGVAAIWLSPIYPSPGLDVGYDVADHSAVDPVFGSLADFDRLVAEAHARGLKVILDLVLNHTSDRHAWFEDSRSSRENPHADWFIWRDPAGFDRRGRPRPPNNWLSFFGGSAWEWEPRRRQFYMHTFLVEQPEVNWRNSALREAQLDVLRFWLARGVDGFRLDVFNSYLKSPGFESNPRGWTLSRSPWDRQWHLHDKDQPEFQELLRDLRAVIDAEPGRMSVGELFAGRLERAAAYTVGSHLVFDFGLIQTPWDAQAMGREIDRRERAYGPDRWPAVVFSNHDQSRHVSRFSRRLGHVDAETSDRVAKAAAVLVLTMRGTPFLYYGEEIGLRDVAIPGDEIVDPPARKASFLFPWWNRDQCRSPMPWTGRPSGGFTTGHPWLRMSPDTATRNVAAQRADGDSVLALYRRILEARRASPALSTGSFARVDSGHRNVLAYVREADEERMLVAVNFAAAPAAVALPAGTWRPVVGTRPWGSGDQAPRSVQGLLPLAGLEAVVLRLDGPAGARQNA
jgi:alpha-glucosidase